MRILLVVHGFPPAAQGGTEIYASVHARTLRSRFGDDVFVVTRDQDPSRPEFATRLTTDTRSGASVAWINNTFRRTRNFSETYANPSIDAVAARLIDQFEPDVAHIHHLTCLSTGIVRLLGARRVPIFMTLHDYWLMCHRGQLLDLSYRVCRGPEPPGCANCVGEAAEIGAAGYAGAAVIRSVAARLPPGISRRVIGGARRLAQSLTSTRRGLGEAEWRVSHMREICGAVTRLFAPSEHIRQRFIQFGVPADRILTSPYGIEPLGAGIARQPSDRLRIGFAGSLMVSKAPHLLIEAFQRLPSGTATLDLFGAYSTYHGDDRYWPELAKWANDGRIRFHGGVPHERIPEVFASIDVLVVPSIWPETSPIVIREALAAGVPVVASRIGGIPETVVDGVNGILFNPGDATDLHRALARLIAEPGLVDTLRRGIGPVRTIEEDVSLTRGQYGPTTTAGKSERPGTTACAGPAPPARTSAIVLSYGAPEEAILAIRSLQHSRPSLRIIVVENGADPVSRETLSTLGDDVTVIQTGKNLGFSGGMNVGIRKALADGATHMFLVNSDMIVPPDCVAQLHAALDATGAGLAGPVVLSRAVPDRAGTLGISYRPSTGRMKHRSSGAYVPLMDAPANRTVDAISGCAILVRREVIDVVGLLDEEYFFTFEDLDWCFRARRAGFESVLAAQAIAYHAGGRSIGDTSPRRLYYAARNHLRFAEREGGGRPAGPASWWRGTSIVALNLAHAVKASGGSLPSRLAAVARGTRDHIAGRYGEDGRGPK